MVFSRIRLRDAVVQPKRLSASVPNSLFTLAIASLSGSGGAVHKLGVRSGPSAWNGSGGHRAVRPTLKLVDTRAADGVVKAWSLKWSLRRRQGLIPRAWVYGRPDWASTLVPLGHRSVKGLPSVPAQKCARVGSIGPVCSAKARLVSRALCVGHGPDFMLKSPVDASKSFARVVFQLGG